MREYAGVRYPPVSSGGAAAKAGVSSVERWLLRIPVLLSLALGLAFGLTRFVVVLSDDLRQSPSDWGAVLFLAVILGGVAALIVIASTAIGWLVGLLLQFAYGVYRK